MTTEATHTCELIERHTILLPTDDLGADAAIQSTTIMAENWAKDQGMELRGISSIVAHNEAGVTFTVTVGKGNLAADPAATSWRWSARMLHWRKVLSNGDGREGRRIVLARLRPAEVEMLTDEHTDRVWTDKDGDVWAWGHDDWMMWTPGDWEASSYMDPAGYGPFTEVRKP